MGSEETGWKSQKNAVYKYWIFMLVSFATNFTQNLLMIWHSWPVVGEVGGRGIYFLKIYFLKICIKYLIIPDWSNRKGPQSRQIHNGWSWNARNLANNKNFQNMVMLYIIGKVIWCWFKISYELGVKNVLCDLQKFFSQWKNSVRSNMVGLFFQWLNKLIKIIFFLNKQQRKTIRNS